MRAPLAMSILSLRAALAALAALAVIAGCDGRGDLDGRRRPIPGLVGSTETGAGVGEGESEISFDFIDNRAAALVTVEGALTASGRGMSFALLSRGGAPTQWRLGHGSRPTARVDGQVAHVIFPFDRDPGGIAVSGGLVPIAMRFHPAARDQLASVFLNETKVGDIPMTEVGTAEYRIDVPASLFRVGENDLRLFFRYAVADERLRTAGALERITIGGASAAATAPVSTAPVERDGARLEAISCQRPTRISVYALVAPARPRLTFQVAGTESASVRVASGAAASREVWRGSLTGAWQSVTVDLSDLAGELVRFDLVGTGATDWGKPQLVSEPNRAASSASAAATSHVIVWIVGGLRADALAEGGPMPALATLAASGTAMTATSRAPVAELAAAEILAGRLPDVGPIAAGAETLAERFREAGYKTSLYSNAPPIAGDGQGFDRVVRAAQLSAGELWQRAHADLKKNADARTLAVVWVDEAALPWAPDPSRLAPEWRSYSGRVVASATKALSAQLRAGAQALSPRDAAYIEALYRGELEAVDGAIATMQADIEALGLTRRSAVIVVGDRGQELGAESFGEGGGLEAAARLVPFVTAAPGRPKIAAADRLVVTADAYATALDLGQISLPAATDGESIYAPPVWGRALLLSAPGRARGLATAKATWIEPVRGPAVLAQPTEGGGETTASAEADPVTARALINWMSILTATGGWDRRRWGRVTSLRPAFSTEHGGL